MLLSENSTLPKASALTWRVWLAVVVFSGIFMPLSIYIQLSIPVSVNWVPIVLLTWVLLGKFFGRIVTKEEAFLIRFGAVAALGNFLLGNIFLGFIKNNYIAYSAAFKTAGIEAPWWYALPMDSIVLYKRTFLDPTWLPLIAVSLFSALLNIAGTIALSFITYELYVKMENLPFPYAQIMVSEVVSLTEADRRRTSIFFVFALLGSVLGILIYGLPAITLALFDRPMGLGHPLYWNIVDLTPYIESTFPGATYAISLDLTTIMIGWIIPDYILISMLVGNIATWLIGGHLAFVTPIHEFDMWRKACFPGADAPWLYMSGTITLWVNIFVGMTFAAGTMFFLLRWRDMKKAFAGVAKYLGKRGGMKVIFIYSLTMILSFLLFVYLVPDFPWVYTLPLILWGFLTIFVSAWAAGVGTELPTLPYARHLTILLSGYRGTGAWFAWPETIGGAAANLTGFWKAGESCGVSIKDMILVMLVAYIPFLAFSLLATEIFWKLAPIPSSFYPMTMIAWPIEAVQTALWPSIAKGGTIPGIFQPQLILMSFVGSALAMSMLALFKLPLGAFLGFIAGSQAFPSLALSLIFSLISKRLLKRMYPKTWEEDRVTIPAGFGMGTSITIGVCVGILIIIKNMREMI